MRLRRCIHFEAEVGSNTGGCGHPAAVYKQGEGFDSSKIMSKTTITPVILCGGSGSRLWPRSREAKPKPFLPLIGEQTLFQQTLRRCQDPRFAASVVITGELHLEHVERQLGNIPIDRLIVEPEPKNTAAAIALAANLLPGDSLMLVCPSDHHIGDRQAFVDAAGRAADLTAAGWLVALAVEAATPDTGFGYLRRGEAIDDLGFMVAQFVEKPDEATARSYLESGEYAWNSGIFAFRARDFLTELERHRPNLAAAAGEAARNGREDGRRFFADPAAYSTIESESVDYAIFENTAHAAMVTAAMDWSDIGSWQALHLARAKDESGNVASGPAELVDCRNVMVDSDGARVFAIGLDGIIVVVDGNDIIVTTSAGARKVGDFAVRTDGSPNAR